MTKALKECSDVNLYITLVDKAMEN